MILIVGLGNPGKEYIGTRHNVGYAVVDEFAKEHSLSWRYNPDWVAYYVKTDDYVLLKPATFMNKSGVSVVAAAKFYKIEKKNIMVIHDELDLPVGKIRISFDSLSAGHKGIDSIIQYISVVEFGRLRLGIDKPSRKAEVEKYVLRQFTKDEKKKIKDVINISISALKSYLTDGIDMAMNRFN